MPTDSCINVMDATSVCELFQQAAEANKAMAGRSGCVVDLPDRGRVTLTGDLHDHASHFEAIVRLARINYSPNYHVVYQEVVHGEHLVNGRDFSYRRLAQIAQLKVERPDQIHHVLSNHEIAQMTGEGILKDGASVVEAFDQGLEFVFGDEARAVRTAINAYIASLPLAVRCANGIMCLHSLPSPCHKEAFDPTVINRELTRRDFTGPAGHAYVTVWGRGLAQTVADELAAAWGARLFVLGHQHVDMGWETVGQSMLILNSDHSHGVALPVDLSHTYTMEQLCEELVPLVAVMSE